MFRGHTGQEQNRWFEFECESLLLYHDSFTYSDILNRAGCSQRNIGPRNPIYPCLVQFLAHRDIPKRALGNCFIVFPSRGSVFHRWFWSYVNGTYGRPKAPRGLDYAADISKYLENT
jgi:hypothetical protein